MSGFVEAGGECGSGGGWCGLVVARCHCRVKNGDRDAEEG